MAEGTLNSLIANRLALRDSNPDLYAELESRMPIVGNHPNTTAEVQGMPNPDIVQSMATSVASAMPPKPAVPGVPQEGGQPPNQLGALVSKLFEDMNAENSKKAKPIGPDLFGNGGILGSGISPVTALMYALGGLATSRMPQQQALAMTMQIGQMPQAYEQQKQQLAQQQVQTILSGINASTAGDNLKARQAELLKKTQENDRKESFINSVDLSKGSLTAAEKLKGVFAGVLPASILSTDVDYVDSVDASGNPVKEVRNKMTGQLVLNEQGQPTILPQVPKKDTTRPIGMTELKVFADTGVRGVTIPADLSREAAAKAVKDDLARQVVTAGGKAGAVAANTPASPEAQEKVLNFGNFINLLENIDKGFKDEYVGPVRGRTYGLARQGMPGFTVPKEDETKFRADLENAKSILVLVRSGAAAAEPEFARLGGVIGEPTDDPKVIRAAIKNILKQAKELQAERRAIINTPKKDISSRIAEKDKLDYTASQADRINQLQKELAELKRGGATALPPGAGEKVE